jgi:hypothetical protein
LAHPGLPLEPSAVKWVASKKEALPEMRFASGKIDMHSRRSVGLSICQPFPNFIFCNFPKSQMVINKNKFKKKLFAFLLYKQ